MVGEYFIFKDLWKHLELKFTQKLLTLRNFFGIIKKQGKQAALENVGLGQLIDICRLIALLFLLFLIIFY